MIDVQAVMTENRNEQSRPAGTKKQDWLSCGYLVGNNSGRFLTKAFTFFF